MNTYRVLIYVDGQPEAVALLDLPPDLVPLDSWSKVPMLSSSPHEILIELRRIT